MRRIEVAHDTASDYLVLVDEGQTRTEHVVTVEPGDIERYAPGSSPEALVRASFEFLLEREPKESILTRFKLPVIERYFPEYRRLIARRLERA